MKKLSEIARTLLDSRSLVPPRVLQEKLGSQGYTEALRRNWIAPDAESGSVHVSGRRDHREAMLEAAKELPPATVVAAQTGVPARGFFGEATSVVNLAPVEANPATPATTPPGASPAGKPADIGDQVTVSEAGQTYTARVASKNPDGSMKLSFSGQKPPRDTFKANEIRVTGTVPTGAPVPSAPAAV